MRKAKRDLNHQLIKKHIQALGGTVILDLASLGQSCDLLIGYKGRAFHIEIKNPDRIPKKAGPDYDRWNLLTDNGKGKEDEKKFATRCGFANIPYYVIISTEEATELLTQNPDRFKVDPFCPIRSRKELLKNLS